MHYLADPEKDAAWAEKEKAGMTDPARYRQEYEIDFSATAGELMFIMNPSSTLCESFPIPKNWTRYMALDPHPRVPHAMLWCAVDPEGNHWYYRELWPSDINGQNGNPPQEDFRAPIKDYVDTVQWLESADNGKQCANGEPQNLHLAGEKERIYKRVIDYAARGMGKGTSDDPAQPNFQKRFEDAAAEIGLDFVFEDAQKDYDVGVEIVNQGLRPLPTLHPSKDEFIDLSRIRIFQDKCPELVWELGNTRYKKLTPAQAETKELPGDPVHKRDHMVDCLRYIEMAGPEFIPPPRKGGGWRPISPGVNY